MGEPDPLDDAVCRRVTRKRRSSFTPSKISNSKYKSVAVSDLTTSATSEKDQRLTERITNFVSFNESDLALASIDDAELYTDFTKTGVSFNTKEDSHLDNLHVSVSMKTELTGSVNNISHQTTQVKRDNKEDFVPCSPEEDLFDEEGLFNSSRLSSPKDIEKIDKFANSLDDSFSEYFFMTRDEGNSNVTSSSEEKNKGVNKCETTQGLGNIKAKETQSSKDNHTHVGNDSKQIMPVAGIGSSLNHQTPTSAILKKRISTGSSLKEKLKQKLHSNAGITKCNRKIEDDVKQQAIIQAKIDASQIRKEGTDVDIGPFFGLPVKVQQLLETSRKITKLYNWQEECLKLQALKDRKNLIYSLPTSGGKTLVAEILMMRELLCYKRDVLLVLPFVSIVQEKVRSIAEFATELGFIVEEYAGSKGRFPPVKRREKKSLYIATMEKAHSIVNSLIENDRMDALGLVVVDELHMIGEGGSRGANLESMLLKIVVSRSETQVIGMSATLNNVADLQTFLGAELYSNDFRPVSLKEFVKVEDNVFSVNNKALTEDDKLEHEKMITFPYAADILKQDPDHLLGLVMEVVPDHSCLVFCSTKKNCENVALMLSKMMNKQYRHLTGVNRDKRKQLLRELSQDGQGKICPVLEFTVHFGLAYHHSGLTMDERRLLEDAYSEGTLCLLACTSTLAAGVNLPAKRVILRSPYVGMSLIKYSQYKQMVGRAGRAGIDSSGESFLIVKKQDRMKVKDLLAGPQDVCHSSLAYEEGKGVRTLLLSSIGLKIVTSTEEAFQLMKQSLLHTQAELLNVDVQNVTMESIQYLLDQGLIVHTKPVGGTDLSAINGKLEVTPIGRATFKGSVDHAFSSQLYKDLKSAEVSLNLATYLHLLFLVTPYDQAQTIVPAWDIYFKKFCKLSEVEVKVAGLVGVPENYLGLRAGGRSSKKKICVLTVNRFYLTLMLWELWNQRSVWEVAEAFNQTRGFIQNLLSQAAAFSSCVLHFCQELEEFWAYQELLGSFVKRLAHCVTSELLPLMEVPGVKLARAKQLYTAGYRSVASLANADEAKLIKAIEHLSRTAARQIISSSKNILEEKTAALMEEVDLLTTVDMPKDL